MFGRAAIVSARQFGRGRLELWEIGFGAGVVGVFAIFTIALALASWDYDRAKR